jgi:hypothetical protein
MNLPSFVDMAKVAEIGVLVLMIIQYFKRGIPETWIPIVSVLVGILISFGYLSNTVIADWTPYMIFVTIVNGVAGAIGADTAYSFVSNTKSPTATLPSKAQIEGGTK